MSNELNSIPEALAAEIQQLAEQMIPRGRGSNAEISCCDQVGAGDPAVHRALLEVARSTPELFASMMLAALGVEGIQLVEVRSRSEDKRVSLNNGSYNYSEVVPHVTSDTITREVRLIRPQRERRT